MLDQPMDYVESADLGKASRISDAAGRYIEFCKSTFPAHLGLDGYKIVVDCAMVRLIILRQMYYVS